MFDFIIAVIAVAFLYVAGFVFGCVAAFDTFRTETPDLYEEWKRRRAERKDKR